MRSHCALITFDPCCYSSKMKIISSDWIAFTQVINIDMIRAEEWCKFSIILPIMNIVCRIWMLS